MVRRSVNWLRRSWNGASAFIGSVFVTVLFAPVLPTYTTPSDRRGDRTAPELLIDTVRPDRVVLVLTPEFSPADLERLKDRLDTAGTTPEVVRIDDGYDPDVAVTQTGTRLLELCQARGIAGHDVYVDVTGGTKTMTLAMARAASLVGADCVYVASRYGPGGGLVHGSQQAFRFGAADLLAPDVAVG